jgi:hypothetical protein
VGAGSHRVKRSHYKAHPEFLRERLQLVLLRRPEVKRLLDE